MKEAPQTRYDAIVIGSGFGGSMVASPLVGAGMRVLMLERGHWVERGEANWGEDGPFVLTPHYTRESRYSVNSRFGRREQGICTCVGGPSVFYGGASFRFRELDFTPPPEIVANSGAEWPFGYTELEGHYREAERLLGVAGEAGQDPTEPARSAPYPAVPARLAGPSAMIETAARSLGLRPFRIPTAIDRATCVSCITCDAFACAVNAKNDLATRVLPGLLRAGMELRTGTVAVRIRVARGRVVAVDAVDVRSGRGMTFSGERVILAAGALATPHLILSSGLERLNPGGHVIGRYLMRHCNAMTYGYFREPPNPRSEHHKQLAVHDFYFGDPRFPALGKLGNIQQVMAPPASLIRAILPPAVRTAATLMVAHLTGLLVIAEDQPCSSNRVTLGPGRTDRFGLPPARIQHRYSRRDLRARRVLRDRAREVLRVAGARFTMTWNVNTFSHAVGTVRMGSAPNTSALDAQCRFRGVPNLWVADGSVFPTSAGVNPSLTIAANALRVGEKVVGAG